MENQTPRSQAEQQTRKRIDAIELQIWREFREKMQDNEIMSRILQDEFKNIDAESYKRLQQEI